MIRTCHVRMGFRYLLRRFRSMHPFEVEAGVLNQCNLNCIYCCSSTRSPARMTTAQWMQIIHDFASLGTLRFKFHGGEPTLREDFLELTREVRAAGMISAAVTNGLVTASVPGLLDHLDELVVSFDSPRKEVNDQVRGKGSYDAAVRTIDLALKKGVKTYVNMVLTRENLEDLEGMLRFCEARGIRMNAQPVVFGGIFYHDRARFLSLTDAQIRSVHRRFLRWKNEGRPLLFSAWAYRAILDWTDYDVLSVPSEGASSCVAGRDYIRIEANGDVIPCCQYSGDFLPKNILKDGLEQSLLHVQTHHCARCWLAYYNERNALFKLRPSAVREALQRG
jgi:MoaA/NifB/PqqE/SkfB family radical SAM enzyme